MTEKSVSDRLAPVGGREVRAEQCWVPPWRPDMMWGREDGLKARGATA